MNESQKRELSAVEKDEIRNALAESVANGATAQRLKALRVELAQRYRCSLSQITATGAWKKSADNTLALRKTAMVDEKDTPDIPAPPTAPDVVSVTPAAPALRQKTEYDYPEKQEARFAYRKFIADALTPEELATANVLHFCAEDWLEVRDIYDPLGIPRHRVLGVENNPLLIPKARENAERLGTRFHDGDLQALIQTPEFQREPPRIVILDFTGPYSENTLNILRALKTQRRAVVIVNLLGKREGKGTQSVIKGTHAFLENVRAVRDGDTTVKPLTSRLDVRHEDVEELALAETRESLGYLVFHGLSKDVRMDPAVRMHFQRMCDLSLRLPGAPTAVHKDTLAAMNFQHFQAGLRTGFQEVMSLIIPRQKAAELITNLPALLLHGVYRYAKVEALESYEYKNPNTGSPFQSQMGLVQFWEQEDASLREFTVFLLTVLNAMLEQQIATGKYEYAVVPERITCQPLRIGEIAMQSDRLAFYQPGQRSAIARMNTTQFINVLPEFGKRQGMCKLIQRVNSKHVEPPKTTIGVHGKAM